MKRPRVSVVVCTCDGAQYIGRQLRSVLEQSQGPDEVIVSDDASCDGTLDEVQRSLEGASCAVTVVRNRQRLGVTANFGKAISVAEGDIIVLSDQDDVWERRKLELLSSLYTSDPSLAAAFTDAALVDSDLRPLSCTLWEALRFGRREQVLFERGRGVDVLLRRNVVAGATLSFHARLRDVVLPMPRVGLHDGWIALMAAASGKVAAVPAPLVRYRLHKGNHVGVSSDPNGLLSSSGLWPDERCDEIAFFAAAADRLSGHAGSTAGAIDGKIAHLRRRQRLPDHRLARAPVVLPAVMSGQYGRYSRGLRSAVYDLVRGGRPNDGAARRGSARLEA